MDQSNFAEPSSVMINPEEVRELLERLSARDGVLGDGRATVADVAEATAHSPEAVMLALSAIRSQTPSAHEVAKEMRSIEMRQELKMLPYALILFFTVLAGALIFKTIRQERRTLPQAPAPITVEVQPTPQPAPGSGSADPVAPRP